MSTKAAHHEESSARGWSIRLPRRDAFLVLGALVLGGGGTSGLMRLMGTPGDDLGKVLTHIQTKQEEQDKRLADHDRAIQELQSAVAPIPEIAKAVRVIQRNQLLGCRMLAQVARQPNPCVEP